MELGVCQAPPRPPPPPSVALPLLSQAVPAVAVWNVCLRVARRLGVQCPDHQLSPGAFSLTFLGSEVVSQPRTRWRPRRWHRTWSGAVPALRGALAATAGPRFGLACGEARTHAVPLAMGTEQREAKVALAWLRQGWSRCWRAEPGGDPPVPVPKAASPSQTASPWDLQLPLREPRLGAARCWGRDGGWVSRAQSGLWPGEGVEVRTHGLCLGIWTEGGGYGG